jgi:hypothetical protein
MTAAARIRELGDVLAAGIQRLLARGIKPSAKPRNCGEQLDVLGQVEAPCGPCNEIPT